MTQPSGRFRFGAQTHQVFVGGKRSAQNHLQGHCAVETQLASLNHSAHSATANFAAKFVVSDPIRQTQAGRNRPGVLHRLRRGFVNNVGCEPQALQFFRLIRILCNDLLKVARHIGTG